MLLARLIRERRSLLVLDGLEPLQYPPGPMVGRLKDQALQALVKELAADNPGLCLITTRIAVADLEHHEHPGGPAAHMDLHALSESAGAQLLAALNVTGSDAERRQASREFAGHPLALTLLGTYLRDAWGGDIRHRAELRPMHEDTRPGHHAHRVMESYARWLEPRHRAVLGLVGLFDRAAIAELVAVLRSDPPIPGLTDSLAGLRKAHLLVPDDGTGSLDAHPLVRAYFGGRVRQDSPEAWTAAHLRLYEHLRDTTTPTSPTPWPASPRSIRPSPTAAPPAAINRRWTRCLRRASGGEASTSASTRSARSVPSCPPSRASSPFPGRSPSMA